MALTDQIDKVKTFFSKVTTKEKKPEYSTIEARSSAAKMSAFGFHGNNFLTRAGGLSGGAKYPGGLSGDGRGNILDHFRIRQNARTAYHESPDAKAIVNRFSDTVIGVGLKLEPMPVANILGMDQERIEDWSERVAERFDLWMKSKQCHRRQTMTGYQLQRLYQIQQERENDNFVRLFYSNEKNLISPLQFDFIDPDQIRGTAFTTTYGMDSNFPDGINRDSKGREKSYMIWIKDPVNRGFKPVTVPRIGEKSKRIFMLHGFCPEYSFQGRGFSKLSHALQELQKLTDLSLSAVNKAINQSLIAMTVESDNENPAVNPLTGMTQQKAGPSVAPVPTGTEQTGAAAEAVLPVEYRPLPEAVDRVPGSVGVFTLEGQQKLKAFENKAAADDYAKLVDTFISTVSASSSMPVEVLKMRFGSNYSASRGALIMFYEVAKIRREECAADFLDPLYMSWLSEEIARGQIEAPGWSDPLMKQAWLNARWVGTPMPNIDPMKTMSADRGYIEMGATTQGRVALDLNGSSVKANLSKNARDFPNTPIPPWEINRSISKSENTSIIDDE